MASRFLVILIMMLAICPAIAFAGADADLLEQAARQLGDADPDVRDKAAATLRGAGASAEPALRLAVESGDPETARRARALLRQLKQPEIEEPPLVDPPELAMYRRGRKS